MEDRDFIDFKFGDHWASDFNLLAVSSGDRYSPPVYGSVNPNTAIIAGKVGVYKWKTQVNEKVFNIKIAFDNINGQILNQIKEWLNPFKIDKLVFKEEPYKYYWVALNTEPKLDFLPFLEETKVVNGIAFKEGVYKGEFELQFVCFDNYGYSDWQSFDENYDYVVKEIEGEEFISFNDGSDNNLIITKIEGNSKQKIIEEVKGKEATGEFITVNDIELEDGRITISGNSKQETREGYNIVDISKFTDTTRSGITITRDVEKGCLTLNGTSTSTFAISIPFTFKAETIISYALNNSQTNAEVAIRFGTANSTIGYLACGNKNIKKENFTLTEDIKDLQIRIGTGITLTNFVIYPQVEIGETLHEFELYGVMPSFEFKSEVETIKDKADLVVCNKNVAKEIEYLSAKMQYARIAIVGYYFEKGKKYKISFDTPNTGIGIYLQSSGIDVNYSANYQWCTLDGKRHTFVVTALETKYTKSFNGLILRRTGTSDVETGLISNLMITEYDDTEDYEEHQEQAYELPIQQEFCKIGDYKDIFVKIASKWYEKHSIEKNIFTGNEDWQRSSVYSGSYFLKHDYISDKPIPNTYVLCNRGKCIIYDGTNYTVGSVVNDTNSFGLRLTDGSEISTIDDWKAYLKEQYDAGTPLYFYYILVEPKLIPCTEAQSKVLDEIYNCKIYKPTTHLFSTNTINPIFTLKYNYVLPSPSLEVPSEIEAIKDKANFVVCNKNFLKNNWEDKTLNGISLTKNADGSETAKGTSTSSMNISMKDTFKAGSYIFSAKGMKYSWGISRVEIKKENGENIGAWYNDYQSLNVTLEETTTIIFTFIVTGTGTTVDYTFYPMVRLATDDEAYLMNQEQAFSVDIQQEMLEEDGFVKQNGQWYEKHNFGSIVSSNVADLSVGKHSSSTDKFFRFTVYLGEINKKVGTSKIFCTHMKPASSRWNDVEGICSWESGQTFCMATFNTNYDTAEKIKNFLLLNDVKIYYLLETPNLIPCTEEQSKILDEIENNLYSYEGVNHIFSTDEVSPLLSISYIPKQDIYIDYVVNQSNLLNDSFITKIIFIKNLTLMQKPEMQLSLELVKIDQFIYITQVQPRQI